MTVQEVAARLDAKPSGNGWIARCPAHDDTRASLSIGEGAEGRALVKCHAGCSTDAIVAAVGLSVADLFEQPRTTATSTRPRLVETYDYADESETLLYQVVRLEPKDFRQRRPDGRGGWTWSLGDVRRVPFGLPDLVDATDVIIAEGEKDVVALRRLGLVATTNAGGAGKWSDALTAQLVTAGALRVTIVPDNDEPGRAHAQQVARSCHDAGLTVKIVDLPGLPPKGDAADWIAAGGTREQLTQFIAAAPQWTPPLSPVSVSPVTAPHQSRRVFLTPASAIDVRPVQWIWQDRLAVGTLGLLGGREGIGKSIVGYTMASLLTRGRLPGVYAGSPRNVIIAATEDSWGHTIVPRLIAASADLDRVFRVDVEESAGALSLPRDLEELDAVIHEVSAVALILDPLMSRLDVQLDSHKDAEVRVALEPLVKLSEARHCFTLGLIHVNKSSSGDALTTLMASRAFAAVARSVLYAMVDPDNEKTRLLGQIKNNLGRSDLPTLSFQIEPYKVADTPEGPVWTGKLEWLGETDRSIKDAMVATVEMAGDKTAMSEAADWLSDYLTHCGGMADSATVKRDGLKAGHSQDCLKRARRKLHIAAVSQGFPRRTFWSLQSEQPVGATPGETALTTLTAPTGGFQGHHVQSVQSVQSGDSPERLHSLRQEVVDVHRF